MSRWAGYIRVSRVGERADTLISPDLQERSIRSWCASRGHEVEILTPELDASGGDGTRPILEGAIERVERGEVAGIVVAKFDRLSRSMKGQVAMLERIESVGGQVRSVAEDLDPSTVSGRMTRNILFSVAQAEREQRAEEFDRAKSDAIARAVWTAPRVPFGYRKQPDRTLEPHPEEAPLVVRAFQDRAAGRSWRQIADTLAAGVGRSFYGPSVARMIRNRVYLGEARQGKHLNPRAHEPLIDRASWEAAQIANPTPMRGAGALLSGLVRCAGCSWRMAHADATYRCRRRGARGVCPEPAYIAASLLDPLVERTVLAHVSGTVEAARVTDEFSIAEDDLAGAEAELAAFQEATSAVEVGGDQFAHGLRLRLQRVEQARHGLAEARLASPAPDLGDIAALWPTLSVAERRHVLGRSLSVVWVWRGKGLERVRVCARPGPRGLSVQGKPAEPRTLPRGAEIEDEIGVALP